MSFDMVPIADIEKMASAVAASKLFGVKNKDEAMAIMLIAQAEGMHPAAAARDYHVIQGRPAMKADAMYARYLNSGGKVEWHDYTDTKVSATFTHPAGGKVKIEWTIEMAKKIGLASKDNWQKYPRQMLRARTISEGVRTTNPAVAVGIYTIEEVQDFDEKKRPRERDMGPAEVVDELISEAQHKRLEALIAEQGIDREVVKAWVMQQFKKEHFPELTKDEYDALDLFLIDFKPADQRAAGGSPGASPSTTPPQPDTASAPTQFTYISAEQCMTLETLLQDAGIQTATFAAKTGAKRIAMLPANQYERALAWIEKTAKARTK